MEEKMLQIEWIKNLWIKKMRKMCIHSTPEEMYRTLPRHTTLDGIDDDEKTKWSIKRINRKMQLKHPKTIHHMSKAQKRFISKLLNSLNCLLKTLFGLRRQQRLLCRVEEAQQVLSPLRREIVGHEIVIARRSAILIRRQDIVVRWETHEQWKGHQPETKCEIS